jgi:hypothetical protein
MQVVVCSLKACCMMQVDQQCRKAYSEAVVTPQPAHPTPVLCSFMVLLRRLRFLTFRVLIWQEQHFRHDVPA